MNIIAKATAALVAGLVLSGTAHAETYVVGTAVPPFGIAGEGNAEPTGFSVDVMKAIAADAGFDVSFRHYAVFGDVIPALLAGDIDIDATSTTITLSRINMGLTFTGVYGRWTEALVVPASDMTAYTSLDDFAGKAIAAGRGTTYLAGIQAKPAGFYSEIVSIDGNNNGVEAVRSGRVAAYVTNAALMSFERARGNYLDVRVVDTYQPVFLAAGGIAVRSDDTDLLGLIQRSLTKLIADGTIAALAAQWGVGAP